MNNSNEKKIWNKYYIVDAHIHLGYMASLYTPSINEDELIKYLKKWGVKKAICAHHSSFGSYDFGVESLLNSIDKHQGYLYGYLLFNPACIERSMKTLKEFADNEYIVGIKMHPAWHSCFINDPKYNKLWEFASERNIVIISHTWNPTVANPAQRFADPLLFEEVLKKYPDLRIILAHGGGRGEYLYKVLELLDRHKNLFVDFAGDIFVPGLIEKYVKTVGSERILFGTDMPWTDIRYHVFNVIYSDINDIDKEKIFGLNAIKLFNLRK
ncbi:MAG: amidohydrolase [Actinobacteria bacterium]|nr:amidohydrolase [Actinomycetota bacterium]